MMTLPRIRISLAGMLVTAFVVALLGVVHVGRRQQIIQLGYQLARATEELADNQEENRRLRLEKSILTNPERIERLAESLGMTRPGPAQLRVLRVRPGTLGLDAPASKQASNQASKKPAAQVAHQVAHQVDKKTAREDDQSQAQESRTQ